MRDKVIPNLFIIGAPRCGTTSFFNMLVSHPEICPASPKEPFYLVDKDFWKQRSINYHTAGLDGYSNYFKSYKNEKYILDGSTPYYFQDTALNLIPQLGNQSKVLFLLREPAQRVYSNYRYLQESVGIKAGGSFAEYLKLLDEGYEFEGNQQLADAIKHSFYSDYIEAWVDAIGANNVKIYLLEDIIGNADKWLEDISGWLKVDEELFSSAVGHSNPSYHINNKKIHGFVAGFGKSIFSILGEGRFKDRLKSLYYRANSVKHSDDEKYIAELKKVFEDKNSELSEKFSIDISSWGC